MPRLLSSLLALCAVLGWIVPSPPQVHAHEEGHRPHAHGAARGGHRAIHTHPHGCEHHRHEPERPDPQETPEEPHVHGADAPVGVARRLLGGWELRVGVDHVAASASDAHPAWARAVAPAESLEPAGDPATPPTRALDRLVSRGRLLL